MADAEWIREYEDGETVPGTAYRVVRLLGTGGMGSVYEVEHVELGRHYVLKSLLRTLASRQDLIARMRNEWRALGQLQHPNIVDVIHAGTTAVGVPYYVMELLTGETVRERLHRQVSFSVLEATRVAQASLHGLAAAHAIGVVHRDIKPANVFLTRSGDTKVLDFGIAQTLGEGAKITAQGLAIGTPRYMSPEQAAGEKADARADLYAVGLLLYEMLAGEGPFDDVDDTTQQMLAHLHRPPRPISQLASVPPDLDRLLRRALEKNPNDRPASAEHMAAELARFTGDRGSAPHVQLPTPTPPMMMGTYDSLLASGDVQEPGDAAADEPTLTMPTRSSRPAPLSATPLSHTTPSSTGSLPTPLSLRTALGAAAVALFIFGGALAMFGVFSRPASPSSVSGGSDLVGLPAAIPPPAPLATGVVLKTAAPPAALLGTPPSSGSVRPATSAQAPGTPRNRVPGASAGERGHGQAKRGPISPSDDPEPPRVQLPPSGL